MVITQKTATVDAIRVDGILWHIIQTNLGRTPQPICPTHHLRMYHSGWEWEAIWLKCAECSKSHPLPRNVHSEKQYVIDKIDSKIFKGMPIINLDDEAIPIAKEEIEMEADNPYFVKSLLTKSKVGHRLVIYAGKKGSTEKTQIFVEPDIKRLAFDQNNIHPCEVFSKIEVTFIDGSKHTMEKS